MSVALRSGEAYQEVWRAYKLTRDPRARDRLIVKYGSLVKYVAGRLAMGLPPHIDVDDLVSYGVFGLMDAIERFDPARQVKFETYAIARIRGAMLDSLRAYDWIPYSIRQKAKDLERAYAKIEAREGRSATDAEVAEELGISMAQLDKMLQDVRGMAVVSLDEVWTGEDESGAGLRPIEILEDANADDPLRHVEFEDRKRILAEAIAKLPEKERRVVSLYYYEGLTSKEISQILGVSQSRISQLHSKAIMRLRGRLYRQHNI
jgi:RNA polymerase sigma factor for flagellar operon FliA